jgi:hypothetical protein
MMKTKIFRLVLVVLMLAAFLSIGADISARKAGEEIYCGSMVLDVSISGGFAKNPFPEYPFPDPEAGELGTLRIYLHPVGSNLFTITGHLDDLDGNHISTPHGVGGLHYDETHGWLFGMSLTGTRAPAPTRPFTTTIISEIGLNLEEGTGGWWQHSLVAVQGFNFFIHVYSHGDVTSFTGNYSKCFRLDDDEQ